MPTAAERARGAVKWRRVTLPSTGQPAMVAVVKRPGGGTTVLVKKIKG